MIKLRYSEKCLLICC